MPVVAVVGAWVALQQMHLARVKLQHDTYDRKYAVFQAVRWVLIVVAGLKRAPTLEDMRSFINEMAAAPFLFDNQLVKYLNEIERRVSRANGLYEFIIKTDLSTDEQKASASRELDEHVSWLSEQCYLVTEKFRTALELRKQRSGIFPRVRRSR